MSDFMDIFDSEYVEPNYEQKADLIAKLQAGDFHLSFSAISAFSISPRAFIAYKLQERKTTKAMVLGQAVHCLLLEPDTWDSRFFIAPTVDGATKKGKEVWRNIYQEMAIETQVNPDVRDAMQAELDAGLKLKIDDIIQAVSDATGITIVPGSVFEDASARARAIFKNRACRAVLDRIHTTEKLVSFEYEGLKFKGALDAIGDDLLADIKNMPDASISKAIGSIWSRRLHWQAHLYDFSQGGGYDCHILAVDGIGETSVHCFSDRNLWAAERQLKKIIHYFKLAITESLFDPEIWDMSQDFWLRSDMNASGINFL